MNLSIKNMIDRDSAVPMYVQIAQSIQEQIRSGRIAPGQKLPPEINLIKALNVSPMTVRQALSKLVEQGLICRERGRGTFVRPTCEHPTSDSKGGRSIALAMPWGPNLLFSCLVDAAEHVLHEAGYQMILVNHRDDPDLECVKLRETLAHGIDGLIWMTPTKRFNAPLFRKIRESNLPVVMIDRRVRGISVDFVGADNQEGMRQIVQHLIEIGRKKIALIREPQIQLSSIIERQAGYIQALEEFNMEFDPELIFTSRKSFLENGRICAQKILCSNKKVDAICCQTQSTALGVLQILRQANVKIPDEIAVTSFDNTILAEMSYPPLTTVCQNIYSMGEVATKLLLERISNPTRPIQCRRIPCELIIRESTVGEKSDKLLSIQKYSEAAL